MPTSCNTERASRLGQASRPLLEQAEHQHRDDADDHVTRDDDRCRRLVRQAAEESEQAMETTSVNRTRRQPSSKAMPRSFWAGTLGDMIGL